MPQRALYRYLTAYCKKDRLDKRDINTIVDRILVFEDHIDVRLKADIDRILHIDTSKGEVINFEQGTADIEIAQSSANRKDKVFRINVVNEGDTS